MVCTPRHSPAARPAPRNDPPARPQGARGLRLAECKKINASLSALGNVPRIETS